MNDVELSSFLDIRAKDVDEGNVEITSFYAGRFDSIFSQPNQRIQVESQPALDAVGIKSLRE